MTKPATTYKQQIKILKSRNIIINDEIFCEKILGQLNYYRLIAYMLPYKINDKLYKDVTFEKIYSIYEFDRKLRSLLLGSLRRSRIIG